MSINRQDYRKARALLLQAFCDAEPGGQVERQHRKEAVKLVGHDVVKRIWGNFGHLAKANPVHTRINKRAGRAAA